MKLLPALKQKKRYLVFEIVSAKKFTFLEVEKEVKNALQHFFGQLGLSKASPMLLKEKYKSNKLIIKINHRYVDECKATLILIKKIKNIPIIIKSVITAGTLKKASTYL